MVISSLFSYFASEIILIPIDAKRSTVMMRVQMKTTTSSDNAYNEGQART